MDKKKIAYTGVLWIFKLLFTVAIGYLLYMQISGKTAISGLTTLLKTVNSVPQLLYLLAAALLVWVNWGLEALKWQRLMHPIERMSWLESLRSVLCGVAVSMLTPNRTGEYGGRILTLQTSGSLEAIAMALVGSYAQLLANISLGLSGFAAFCFVFAPVAAFTWLLPVMGIMVVLGVLGWLYGRVNRLPVSLAQISWLQKWQHLTRPLANANKSALWAVLCWSFLRYPVYVLQFYLLLKGFGIQLSLTNGWILISSIFFVQTFMPTVAIAELGIKGNLALYFIGFATSLQASILAAVFGLWLLNLLLPALAGLFFIVVSGNMRSLFRQSSKYTPLIPQS
ncbi:MAG TPA: lysylphosphatidylglycerol synthase domain-containing protein [Chitinophagales bacterium]|nr:lysylphosphatidylglycerol synthase domain-containing protein [Chitinophagales bacterium]HRK26268.1 lysylphosphatidylglycerol synthase domain-containing protein [Chitinophagales bacterium]